MQQFSDAGIEAAFSVARLATYRGDGVDTQVALGRYAWNVELSEALYPCLHALEIVLRNALDRAICEQRKDSEWLLSADWLGDLELRSITNAQMNLMSRGMLPTHGSLMAELRFGFWTALFDRRYEQMLWPTLLAEVFPGIPRRIRTRHTISVRLTNVRRLRNRVFHHEPIWYWDSLRGDHSEIEETIGWLSPLAHELVLSIDRFQNIFDRGVRDAP
jgi:hypothetical protein